MSQRIREANGTLRQMKDEKEKNTLKNISLQLTAMEEQEAGKNVLLLNEKQKGKINKRKRPLHNHCEL